MIDNLLVLDIGGFTSLNFSTWLVYYYSIIISLQQVML